MTRGRSCRISCIMFGWRMEDGAMWALEKNVEMSSEEFLPRKSDRMLPWSYGSSGEKFRFYIRGTPSVCGRWSRLSVGCGAVGAPEKSFGIISKRLLPFSPTRSEVCRPMFKSVGKELSIVARSALSFRQTLDETFEGCRLFVCARVSLVHAMIYDFDIISNKTSHIGGHVFALSVYLFSFRRDVRSVVLVNTSVISFSIILIYRVFDYSLVFKLFNRLFLGTVHRHSHKIFHLNSPSALRSRR